MRPVAPEATTPAPADMGQQLERLLADARTRQRSGLLRRERLAHAGFALGFVVAALALLLRAPGDGDLWLAAAMAAAYAAVAGVEFSAGAGCVVPTQVVFVPMLLLLPPSWAPLLVAAALLVTSLVHAARGRVAPGRSLLSVADAWFALGPATVLVLAGVDGPSWDALGIYTLALAAQFVVDAVVAAARMRAAIGLPVRELLHDLRLLYVVDALLAPVGLMAAFAGADHPFAALLVLPLVALFAVFSREREARIDQALELSQAYRGTALLLGDVIEADDQYTGDHTQDVVELAVEVADALGVDEEVRRGTEFGALLHDVGKIHVPNEIINKRGPLDDDEWAVMRQHTVMGQQMLERVGGLLGRVGGVVRASHERWDGGGYPDGLAGEDIPLAARVVCACDAYNAMTTDRSYRPARPAAAALEEMRRCAGSQFDPAVVDALEAVVRRRG